jgi:hypothetical protein
VGEFVLQYYRLCRVAAGKIVEVNGSEPAIKRSRQEELGELTTGRSGEQPER